MLRILIVFLVLGAGLIIGPLLAGHQGLVFIQVAGYRIKMSLTVFMLTEIFFLLFIYLFFWLFYKIINSHTLIGGWLRMKSPKRTVKRIEQAQLLLLEGDYKKASKLLAKSAKMAPNSPLTYLQAAQAEINTNQFDAAREHLDKAAKTCQENEKFAFKLIQIRLQIKTRQFELAKKGLELLLEEKPRNSEVLRLAYQLYYDIKDYQSIIDIIPALYKAEAFSETELDQFKDVAYVSHIKQLAENKGLNALASWWQEQPKTIRGNTIYQKTVDVMSSTIK